MTKNKKKKLGILLAILVLPLFLAGCGGRTAQQAANNVAQKQANAANGGQNQQSAVITTYQGEPSLVERYVSVPFIIQNMTKSPIQFDSANVSLEIKSSEQKTVKHWYGKKTVNGTKVTKLSNYSPYDAPSNYELQMGPNDQLQTFLTFKLTEQQYLNLTKSEIESAKVVYKTPNGKTITASQIPNNATKSQLGTQLSQTQPMMFSDYYKQLDSAVTDYKNNEKQQISQLKDQIKQDQGQKDKQDEQNKDEQELNNDEVDLANLSVSKGLKKQFEQNFNDPEFGNLSFTICRENQSNIMFKIDNPTQENMEMQLNNFKLVASNLSDITISPEFNNYSLYIPAEKTTYAVLPTSSNISPNAILTPEIKIGQDDNNGKPYMNTKELPNPIQYEKEDDD